MKVELQYGRTGLTVELPTKRAVVIRPTELAPLRQTQEEFVEAVDHPIGAAPLRELVHATDRVAIVIPDITRPMPSRLLLPWLLETIACVPSGRIVIVTGTGSHRANTEEELAAMVGRDVYDRVAVVNHDAYDPSQVCEVGRTPHGHPVRLNRHYVEADKRILLGFIEPHFIAGFSGGYKAIVPGIVDIDSIMEFHSAPRVGDPRSTWGELADNPTQALVRGWGAFCPADFCINVTLDSRQRITRYFCGGVNEAHDAGCTFVREHAMVPCDGEYPIVITTNSGYPLDLNLYQTVKGMSAAAKITAPGGMIVTAAECVEGFPEHGNFRELMHRYASPMDLLEAIRAPGFSLLDQWEAQLLALIQQHARVVLQSTIPDEAVSRAFIEPTHDIAATVGEELKRIGRDAPVAVLPQGFMAVPYVRA